MFTKMRGETICTHDTKMMFMTHFSKDLIVSFTSLFSYYSNIVQKCISLTKINIRYVDIDTMYFRMKENVTPCK